MSETDLGPRTNQPTPHACHDQAARGPPASCSQAVSIHSMHRRMTSVPESVPGENFEQHSLLPSSRPKTLYKSIVITFKVYTPPRPRGPVYTYILVDLGDFGQIPGPSSVLFGGCALLRVLRFPRTPPLPPPSPAKKGGGGGAAARARRARKKSASPPQLFFRNRRVYYSQRELTIF